MRLRITKMVLWFLVGAAVVVGVARFLNGLGATTSLTDDTPWGLWIGFDVFGGVALAAGGFVIAGTVYVFHLEKYRPILRAAVLTAFLGYAAVVVGLLFDLGKPWNIWRPVFHWQPHSALFEVAWCVILYLTVLALEFSPVVLENSRFKLLYRLLKKATVPLVILGIMLSTLHQSSLGTLMVLAPYRVHPLWYSPILPPLFFVSAVGLGLAMVIVESRVSSWLYQHEPEASLSEGLARVSAFVLAFYGCLRIGDLAIRGSLSQVTDGSWMSTLFIAELAMSTIVPVFIFALPRTRKTPSWVVGGAFLVVAGFVLNRISVSGLATLGATGSDYVPAWTELSISVGVVAAAALAFFFFVEHFNVYETPQSQEAPSVPTADPVTGVRLSEPWFGDSRRYSLLFLLGAGLAFGLLPDGALSGAEPEPTPVREVRVAAAHKVDGGETHPDLLALTTTGSGAVENVEAYIIDGNRDGRFVLFDHSGHQERDGDNDSCGRCHHLNAPLSRATACVNCHADMYEPTDTFNHAAHIAWTEGNDGCTDCHRDSSQPKTRETSTPCLDCHQNMVVADTRTIVDAEQFTGIAPGYMDAMHGLCIECHRQAEQGLRPELEPHLGRCATCHTGTQQELQSLAPRPLSNAVETESSTSGIGAL